MTVENLGVTTHLQAFSVAFEFPVIFTEGLFDPQNHVLKNAFGSAFEVKRHRFVAFVDGGLVEARPEIGEELAAYSLMHADHMEMVGDIIVTPPGEAIKNDFSLIETYQKVLLDRKIDRHSYVVGIGGGALLDAIGLVAATCHRGVRLIRVPTTTLAQNDAGVGVKNGVNLFGAKNFMGSFAPPLAVLNDVTMLDTLNPRDKRAGIAEAIKVALIRDRVFFEWLEENADALCCFEKSAMMSQIKRCAELHMAQIGRGGDPFESGSARPLDFGHWAAHKLEALTNHEVRHGEAVAIGIALDAQYSVLSGLLSEEACERVLKVLSAVGFELWHEALLVREDDGRLAVLKGLTDFQEHLGGELTITLLKDLGVAHDVHEMDYALIGEAIERLRARFA